MQPRLEGRCTSQVMFPKSGYPCVCRCLLLCSVLVCPLQIVRSAASPSFFVVCFKLRLKYHYCKIYKASQPAISGRYSATGGFVVAPLFVRPDCGGTSGQTLPPNTFVILNVMRCSGLLDQTTIHVRPIQISLFPTLAARLRSSGTLLA